MLGEAVRLYRRGGSKLTRRTVVAGLGSLGVSIPYARYAFAAGPRPRTLVDFKVPPGSCDAHVHVIGDPSEFPMSRDRDYTPPPATADELAEVLRYLNLDRVIIVTPTVYDTDNSATIAAIRQLGRERARGIALVNWSLSPDVLDSLREGGIVGVRLLLSEAAVVHHEVAAKHLRKAINVAEPRGWHVDISTSPDVLVALATELASSSVPLVLDYFAWVAGGVDQAGFDVVLSLVKSGRAYVKFSEPYRLSKHPPDYEDLVPVVQHLVAANPDRLLWGSGWPHVDSGAVIGRAKSDLAPDLPIDAGHLLNLLAKWVPDPGIRRKILVDNPAELYGF